MAEVKRNWKADVKIFRERMGGLTDTRKAMQKEQRDAEKAIHKAIGVMPRTVPEIAQETEIPSERIMWYLMAFKRYGKVVEVDQVGDYYRYIWKEARA